MTQKSEPCAWCGGDPVGYVEIIPPVRGRNHQGLMIIKRKATIAWVCKKHSDIMERQPIFYSCGCSWVTGESECPRHHRSLQRRGTFHQVEQK